MKKVCVVIAVFLLIISITKVMGEEIKIHKGMEIEEVTRLLGPPDSRAESSGMIMYRYNFRTQNVSVFFVWKKAPWSQWIVWDYTIVWR